MVFGLWFIYCVSDDFHSLDPCKFNQELIDHGMEQRSAWVWVAHGVHAHDEEVAWAG